ncbi:Zinc finger protein DZIP1 N-terminal [Trinorchestia longiramus]|nr:Zinc finger protein DZIP1 N-terminal [Trinorchestia longiramus]
MSRCVAGKILSQDDGVEFSNINLSPHQDCSGALQIDWQKLASVELSELTSLSMVDPSVIMDHYPYVSLCDASSELDLKKAADQKSLLKLFRLAQLLVQHLAAKERNFRRDLNATKKELLIYMDKYTQCKSQLHQQIAEAKKMKVNNRNLRETVKHINSTAIRKGLLQPVKCEHCYKIFRDKNFLASHQQRKHGIHEPPLTYKTDGTTLTERNISNHNNETTTEPRGGNEPTCDIELSFDIEPEINKPLRLPVSTENNTIRADQPTEYAAARGDSKVAANSNFNDTWMDQETTKKLSDVEDACAELHNKMEDMVANFKEKELEWKTELEKNKNEYLVVQSEKVILEEKFKAQFEIMNSKIKKLEEQTQKLRTLEPNFSTLQRKQCSEQDNAFCFRNLMNDVDEGAKKTKSKENSEVAERIQGQSTISVGEMKAKMIADKLIRRESNDMESERSYSSFYNTAGLSSITEMSAEDDSNNMKQDSICDVKSLPSDNDHQNHTGTAEEDSEEQLHRGRSEVENNICGHAQDVSNEFNLATEKKSVREKVRFEVSVPEQSIVQEPLNIPKWQTDEREKENNNEHQGQSNMYEDSTSDDTESSSPNITNQHDPTNELPHAVVEQYGVTEEESTDDSVDESIVHDRHKAKQDLQSNFDNDQLTGSEIKSSSVHDLLKDNSGIWVQLRAATDEVVQDKLKSMHVQDGISSKQYKKVLKNLQHQRNILSRKYPNFKMLRSALKKEMKEKIETQTDNVAIQEYSDIGNKKNNTKEKKTFSMFRNASRSVKSSLSKKSQSLKKITSRSHHLVPTITNSRNEVKRGLNNEMSQLTRTSHSDDCENPHKAGTSNDDDCENPRKAEISDDDDDDDDDDDCENLYQAETHRGNDHESPQDTSASQCSDMTETDTASESDEDNLANQVKEQKGKTSNFNRESLQVNSNNDDQSMSGKNITELKGNYKLVFSASKDDVLKVKAPNDETAEVTSVKGIDNLAYSHSIAETLPDKPDDELQNATDYSSEFISDDNDDDNDDDDDDNDDNDESDEENCADKKFKPQTRVGSLFSTEGEKNTESETPHYNADAFYSSYYNVQEYKPIKLKQPTGRKIIQLKADIESQLRQRQTKKPAGAVNTVLQEQDQHSQEGAPDFRTQVEAFEISSDS